MSDLSNRPSSGPERASGGSGTPPDSPEAAGSESRGSGRWILIALVAVLSLGLKFYRAHEEMENDPWAQDRRLQEQRSHELLQKLQREAQLPSGQLPPGHYGERIRELFGPGADVQPKSEPENRPDSPALPPPQDVPLPATRDRASELPPQ